MGNHWINKRRKRCWDVVETFALNQLDEITPTYHRVDWGVMRVEGLGVGKMTATVDVQAEWFKPYVLLRTHEPDWFLVVDQKTMWSLLGMREWLYRRVKNSLPAGWTAEFLRKLASG